MTVVTTNPFILFTNFPATFPVQLHPFSSNHIFWKSQKSTSSSKHAVTQNNEIQLIITDIQSYYTLSIKNNGA